MPEKTRLAASLQENVLALLAYDSEAGKVITNLVSSDLFEGDYGLIAEKIMGFWRKFKEPPRDHTPDLMDLDSRIAPRRMQVITRILFGLHQLYPGVNKIYVMGELTKFIRVQKLKVAIIESAEKLNASEEQAIEDIETVWSDLLRTSEVGFDAGIRINEVQRILDYLSQRSSEFTTGIEELDKRGIVPSRATLTNMLGSYGDGKSWWLINVGKEALLQRKKIAHLSLEIDPEIIAQRYLQSIFSVTSTQVDKLDLTEFKVGPNGRLKEFETYRATPEFSFESPGVEYELETRMELMGALPENLIIKRFQAGMATSKTIEAYLDNLEVVEKFIPDMLIVDYPGLYKTNPKYQVLETTEHIINTRAICVERNIAGVIVHQLNRPTGNRGQQTGDNVNWAFGLNQAVDQGLVLRKTHSEASLGLARIFVDKARTRRDKFEVLIAQSYDIGQFCLHSALMDSKYEEKVERLSKEREGE